jgi:CDP-paratose synthetase
MGFGKNILLTGGTGFLGSRILKGELSSGNRIILLKRRYSSTHRIEREVASVKCYDIDQVPLERAFKENRIDLILHCATDYGRKQSDPSQVIEANLMLPLRLLELGEKFNVPCFINTDTIIDKKINYYSLSKSQFKEWLASCRNEMACFNVALEHFYGPGDDETKFVANMLKLLMQRVDHIDLTLGMQRRDFIYIDDVVDAFRRIIELSAQKGKGFFQYEIGSGQCVSIKDLVFLISRLVGNTSTELRFGAIPYREGEVMESNVHLDAILRLGWKCKVTLEDGLSRVIEYERETDLNRDKNNLIPGGWQ